MSESSNTRYTIPGTLQTKTKARVKNQLLLHVLSANNSIYHKSELMHCWSYLFTTMLIWYFRLWDVPWWRTRGIWGSTGWLEKKRGRSKYIFPEKSIEPVRSFLDSMISLLLLFHKYFFALKVIKVKPFLKVWWIMILLLISTRRGSA